MVLVVHLILARFTLRDLRRRPAAGRAGAQADVARLGDDEHDGVAGLLARRAPAGAHGVIADGADPSARRT